MDDDIAAAESTRRAAEQAHAAHRIASAASVAPLVAMGTDILKAVSFINGGAAIATVYCLGAVLHDRPGLALALVAPLAAFGFGLTVAGCATGFSYFAQEQQARALGLQRRVAAEPFVIETDESRRALARGERFRRLALVSVFVGIASAVLGFSAAGIAFVVALR